jgi:hypothetical protein
MHLIHRHVFGVVAVVAVAVVVCVTAPAFARPFAAHHTTSCSLPNGVEGGGALRYSATNVGCSTANRVVSAVEHPTQTQCVIDRPQGCEVHGFRCRDIHPQTPGHESPGDTMRCTQGTKAITFDLSG